MIVELTDQEAQAVVEMFDIALKHDTLGGIRYAMAAAVIRDKLSNAAQQPPEPKEKK